MKLKRAALLYAMPIVTLWVVAWIDSTNPPVPVLIAFIALLGWPMLGATRRQGELDGIRWAKSRVDAEIELTPEAALRLGERLIEEATGREGLSREKADG